MKNSPQNHHDPQRSSDTGRSSTTYQLLDSGHFEKLEQVGPYRLVRPALSAVWQPRLSKNDWLNYDARFERNSEGGGKWNIKNKALLAAREEIKEGGPKFLWSIDIDGVTFNMKLTGFGHLGIFPEQKANWLKLREIIMARTQQKKTVRVLNLFAYTGGSTLFSAAGGAEVVHLDASKTSVSWARENAESSGLGDRKVRWIVDDVQEFVARELRRGSKYEGIILDPPTYGRGAKNQIWKIEDHLVPLLNNLKALMSDEFQFLLLSSHSEGYTPLSLRNQALDACADLRNAETATTIAEEMTVIDQAGRYLPSGASCLWIAQQ